MARAFGKENFCSLRFFICCPPIISQSTVVLMQYITPRILLSSGIYSQSVIPYRFHYPTRDRSSAGTEEYGSAFCLLAEINKMHRDPWVRSRGSGLGPGSSPCQRVKNMVSPEDLRIESSARRQLFSSMSGEYYNTILLAMDGKCLMRRG